MTLSNRDCSRAIKFEAAKRELRPLNVLPSIVIEICSDLF